MNASTATYAYGKAEPLPRQVRLRAGELEAIYEDGALRYIKAGRSEVLRMIYSAVRDHNWNTIPATISNEQIDADEVSFRISYAAAYRSGPVDFRATYRLEGRNNEIFFSFRGEARAAFQKNRIGFCILHPIRECAGKSCEIEHTDGRRSTEQFPELISPHQPMLDIRAMSWAPAESLLAELRMEGDVFEMEDQRNWTDASYKTYCTPLDQPFPVEMKPGDVIEQRIHLRVSGEVPAVAETETVHIHLSGENLPFPRMGTAMSSVYPVLDEHTVEQIQSLQLDHLRIDVDFDQPGWDTDLATALRQAQALDLRLELALHFSYSGQVEQLLPYLYDLRNRIDRILIFQTGAKATTAHLIRSVVPALRLEFPEAQLGAGTDHFFAELNRNRLPVDEIDLLTFSITPQVHAFDNASLTETLEAQGYAVNSARVMATGKPVVVSPVTLKMRSNPNATGPATPPPEGTLPPQVDPRQMSLYGAVWTLGSLQHLAEAGISAATYYETAGWLGLVQGPAVPSLPGQFPAGAGEVFPLWLALKWALEYKTGYVVRSRSSDPLRVQCLVLQKGQNRRILLGNPTGAIQEVQIPVGTDFRMGILDLETIREFRKEPLPFSERRTAIHHRGENLILEISPFGMLCLEY